MSNPKPRSRSRQPSPEGIPQFIDPGEESAAYPDPGFKIGSRIDRFVLHSKLGTGGMGIVFEAFDPELGRKLAIKLVRSRNKKGKTIRHGRDRLMREAQALARLNHPNIVGLYDIGMVEGGLYLAMEFVRGQGLRKWWRERTRTWQQVLDVFLQAGRGLAAAHGAGIVHRDFKPSNVIVSVDGRVRVLDFGLARGLPDMGTTGEENPTVTTDGNDRPTRTPTAELDMPRTALLSARLTDTNVILGTTGYMSPEQLLRGELGPASDQFSFCVSMYEALYGYRPYSGRDPIEVALSYKTGHIEPTPRGTKVPTSIHRVLLRGLSVDPEDRYASMAALLRELAKDPRARLRRVGRTAALIGTACAAAYAAVWVQHLTVTRSTPAPVQTCEAQHEHDSPPTSELRRDASSPRGEADPAGMGSR